MSVDAQPRWRTASHTTGTRGHRGDDRAGERERDGRGQGRGELVERELRRGADHQPPHEGEGGYADGEHDDRGDGADERPPGGPEGGRDRRAGGTASEPGVAPVAPQAELGEEQEEAEQHQHPGHRRGGGAVERRAVLVVDRGREGREAQQRQGPELGEQVEPDQQRATEQGRAQLGEHDRAEGVRTRVAQRPRRLLQRRVEAAEHRDDREVDEGVVGQGHHQEAPVKPLTPRSRETQA